MSFNHTESNDNPSVDPGESTLRRLIDHSNTAWTDLLNQYFDRVYRWCRDGGLNAEDAADVTQDVFVSVLGSMPRYRSDDGQFAGWLRRITQRRVADFHRRRSEVAVGGDANDWFSQLSHSIVDATPNPPKNSTTRSNTPPRCAPEWLRSIGLDRDRLSVVLVQAQTQFSSNTWQAFWMTAVEDRSAVDVAFDLGMSRNAVYIAKSRVIAAIRDTVEPPPPHPDQDRT